MKLILRLRLYLNHFVWNKNATCELRGHHEELELGTQNRASPTLQLVGEGNGFLLFSVASEIDMVKV